MSRKEQRKKRKRIKMILIVVSFFLFGLGYYLLNVVSMIYQVPFGPTFHVILGCSLMAIALVYDIYAIKTLYFKKKNKKTKPVFLEDDFKNL
ncbi:hypothetical protein [Flavobacterium eburneipallidum]|uniref:hypothetical protein n=1 Tax=Flavobacterium eburneipallidum TaxID=3003263 RepID=UPI002482D2AF|nr:hypothetical protein [Flavobacterium eburneipallidum]